MDRHGVEGAGRCYVKEAHGPHPGARDFEIFRHSDMDEGERRVDRSATFGQKVPFNYDLLKYCKGCFFSASYPPCQSNSSDHIYVYIYIHNK